MAVEVDPMGMGNAMSTADVHRFGDSGALAAAATCSARPAEQVADTRTAVASLDEPSRRGTLRISAREADR